ncbi:MAG: hypothetical protein KC680_02575 [Candidatus Peregrinibacteria bacterium]|nr:hypothetical protein [Candidatus Peregrinibacteria bacterium]MCB9808735.1 hypothetical protein [Candidatus Peribacteria bacterium]
MNNSREETHVFDEYVLRAIEERDRQKQYVIDTSVTREQTAAILEEE